MRVRTLALALAAFAFAACGGEETTTTTSAPEAPAAAQSPATTPAPAAEPAAAVPAYDGPPAEITITPVGNEMKYAETEFTVHPGQQVRLVFNNTATNPAMQHNVVVVKSQADINPVGQAGMSAADNNYVAPSTEGRIIAHTPMSQPGQTVEVTFTAPAEGEYPYICTFPGHYTVMQGVMRVVPATPS